MARTRTISDEQILAAAREVFLEVGLLGTTAEIARRAEISEGTIFKRFETKEQLFLAAMSISSPPWLKSVWSGASEYSVRDNLNQLCLELIAFFEDTIPKMMMVMCSHGGFSRGRFTEDTPMLSAIKSLSLYLKREQDQGRLGACDAEILARMLISSCHHYAFMEQAGMHQYLPMPRHHYVRGVLDNLFSPLEVDP